jgi:peptidoglycan-N-acetylglucosamine deacetylase
MVHARFETARTHWILPLALPLLTWRKPAASNSIYLTFDDGPTPGVTDAILDILDEHSAKATFFCVGQAIESAPRIFERILDSGHSVGNHTFQHLSGTNTTVREYLGDIERCDQLLRPRVKMQPTSFRPPYAQLTVRQGLGILYRRPIVLWDVNSMDYRSNENSESIADRVIQNMRPGSIVLLHDSLLTNQKTIRALPKIVLAAQQRGWRLAGI